MDCLGVGDSHSFKFIEWSAEIFVVLSKGQERHGQGLNVPSLGKLRSNKIGELMNGDLLSYGVGWRESSGNVVVTESDANVFSDVARVHDVSSGGRDLNLDLGLILGHVLNDESHLLSAFLDFCDVEVKAECTVNVGKLNIELVGLKVRVNLGLASSFVMDLNLFNSELSLAIAVTGELTCEYSQANF